MKRVITRTVGAVAVIAAIGVGGVIAAAPASAAASCGYANGTGRNPYATCKGSGEARINESCTAVWPYASWTKYGPWTKVSGTTTIRASFPSCGWGTAIVVSCAVGLDALSGSQRRLRRRSTVALVVTAVALGLVGLLVPTPGGAARTAVVAVVQGNVPEAGLDFNGEREQVLRNHVEATDPLAADVRAGEVAQARPGDLAGERLRHRPVPRPVAPVR